MPNINPNLLKVLPKQETEYYHAYFYIDSGYQWGIGMPKEDLDLFHHELNNAFRCNNWAVKGSRITHACPTVYKGKSHLYCHPMELSGPCERSLYPEVEKILEESQTCKLRFMKEFGQIYDLSDEQYQHALDSVRGDIETDLMEAFSTNRRDQYRKGFYSALADVASRYRITTLDRYIGISSDDIHMRYIKKVFHDLVQRGKILCKDDPQHGKMYRACTGPELLELARSEATDLAEKIQNAQNRLCCLPSEHSGPTQCTPDTTRPRI